MEVPRGFTRCDECEGGWTACSGCDPDTISTRFASVPHTCGPCLSCSGSGLVPTEKLREEATAAIEQVRESVVPGVTHIIGPTPEADAVLRKVAEHLGGGE